MSFGKRLKAARERAGLTQLQIAQSRGIRCSWVNVSLWEHDRVDPRLGKIKTLASLVGLSVEELVTGKPTSNDFGGYSRKKLEEALERVEQRLDETNRKESVRVKIGIALSCCDESQQYGEKIDAKMVDRYLRVVK